MAMGLDGKVAVITGGGAGIGRAICLRLAAEGARIAVLDLRAETGEETLDLIGGDGVALACDVGDSASVDAAFERIERELGPPDVLVNNAGAIILDHVRRVTPLAARQREEAATDGVKTPLEALVRLTDDEWRRTFAVYIDGTFYCTRAAVRTMGPRGQRRDRQHGLDLRHRGLQRAPPLLRRQGCGAWFHEGCRQGADRAGHPGQRGGTGTCRHEHPAGRDLRAAFGDCQVDAGGPAGEARGGGRVGRVPRGR